MIADELDELLDAFMGYFPEVADWLVKHPDAVAKWRESLSLLDFRSAMDSLAGFHRGDLKPPTSWGLWPAEIARQTKRQAVNTVRPYRVIDGHDVYSCLACRDSGMVLCWHPKSMRAMSNKLRGKDGEPHFGQRGTLYTCTVRCYCEAGTQRYPSERLIYSERDWVTCDGLKDAASIERLERFIAAKSNIHPRYADFGEYSAER